MKKKLAALLCGVMCAGAFSGCSTDELGYLKMAANAMDTMKTCEVKGTMQADINFDALETFMTDVAKATGADMVATVGEFPDGRKTMQMDYDMNLDMDITNFVTVGYKGLSEVIDGLGGIYIDVDSEEIKHINNYQIGIAEVLKCDYTPVTETGMQLLNGLQATAYCRIRYTAGNDFKRAARQREVIQAIEDQAKKADYATLSKVFNNAIDDIYTSLDSKDILDLLSNIANYRIVDEGGFPEETMRDTGNIGAKGSCVIPVDLESNVVWLHQFLFDDANYTVTDSVKEYSRKINADTSPYLNK